mmetsp:Transcript_26261/g.37005  ORF Transcript_26261/g.37005 Transcript_26261/m.37005 type:complete len:257 (+) Transcript_26261:167-937(+)
MWTTTKTTTTSLRTLFVASMLCNTFAETYLRRQIQPLQEVVDPKFNWSIHDPNSKRQGTSEWSFSSMTAPSGTAVQEEDNNDDEHDFIVISGTYIIPMNRHYQIQLYDSTCTNQLPTSTTTNDDDKKKNNNNNDNDTPSMARILSFTEKESKLLHQEESLNVRIEIDSFHYWKQQQDDDALSFSRRSVDVCVRLDLLTKQGGESVNFHEVKFNIQVDNDNKDNNNNNTLKDVEEDVSCDHPQQQEQQRPLLSSTTI